MVRGVGCLLCSSLDQLRGRVSGAAPVIVAVTPGAVGRAESVGGHCVAFGEVAHLGLKSGGSSPQLVRAP